MAPYSVAAPSLSPENASMCFSSACPCLGPEARLVSTRRAGPLNFETPSRRVLPMNATWRHYYVSKQKHLASNEQDF